MLAPTRSRSIQYSRTHSSTLLEREADVGSSPTSTTGHAEDRRVSEETQSKAAFNRSGRQLNWSTRRIIATLINPAEPGGSKG